MLHPPSVGTFCIEQPERRLVTWLFLACLAFFLCVQEGAITVYDGRTVFEVTRSMIERGQLDVSEEFNTLPGPDGRMYSRYGLGMSLLAVIPYLVARPFATVSGDADHVLQAAVSTTMAFVAAALVVSLYVLARRIGATVRSAVVVAVGAVAGTYCLPYSKEFFSEPLAALCVVVTIERLVASRPALSGVAFGAAVLVRPQNLLLAPLVMLVALWQHGVRGAVHAAIGAVPGVLATCAYNAARFGSPLAFGYEDVGFTTPFAVGFIGLLLEPRKSVVIFAPIVLLLPFALCRLWGRQSAALVLLGGNLLISCATVVTWFAWHGGWSWGPRLLLPGLVPAIAAIAPWANSRARLVTAIALFAAGLAVSFPALVVPTQAQQLEGPPIPWAVHRAGHFMATQPLRSPHPWRQLQLVIPTARYSLEHRYSGLDDGRNYLRYLSLWQFGVMRRFQQRGLVIALTGTMVLALAALLCARHLHCALRQVARIETLSAQGGRPA
jgi:hypothetical protein